MQPCSLQAIMVMSVFLLRVLENSAELAVWTEDGDVAVKQLETELQ